jgi:O-antigen ligase
VVVTALVLGALMARGGILSGLGLAVAGGLALVWFIQMLGIQALTIWVIAGVVLYPFARYPSSHAYLTFDRAWILSLAVALAIGARDTLKASTATRWLIRALWLLAITALVRGALTSGQVGARQAAIETSLDTIILPGLLFYAARRLIRTDHDWDLLTRCFTIAGVILGLIALGERLLGFELASLSGGAVTIGSDVGVRVSGPYGTDDALAVALLMCMAATLLWVQASPRTRLRVGLAALTIELTGITLTFFRGAWIATLVLIVVSLGLRPRKYARVLGIAALAAAVAGAVLLGAGSSGGLSQRLNNTNNVNGRFATYGQALTVFKEHAIDGVGIDQFAQYQQAELTETAVAGVQAVSGAHDSYLDILAEGGLLVFIPFLLANLATAGLIHRFRVVRRTDRLDILIGATLLGAGLAYILVSLEETVITSSTASNAFFALLLGAGAARLDMTTDAGETDRHADPAGGLRLLTDEPGNRPDAPWRGPALRYAQPGHALVLDAATRDDDPEMIEDQMPQRRNGGPGHGPRDLILLLNDQARSGASIATAAGTPDALCVSLSEAVGIVRRRELRIGTMTLVGTPDDVGYSVAVAVIAAARPRRVTVIDPRGDGMVSAGPARFLLRNGLAAAEQVAGSLGALGAQSLAARVPKRRSAVRSARLRGLTYLRPVVGTSAAVGGAVTHTHEVIKALSEEGVAVQALTNDAALAHAGVYGDGAPVRWEVVDVAGQMQAIPASAGFAVDVAMLPDGVRHASQTDAIYQRHSRFSLIGTLVAAASGRPLFLEYNGPEDYFGEHWQRTPLLARLSRLEDRALRSADRIFVVSGVIRDDLMERGFASQRIVVNPNGVDPERFDRGGGAAVRQRLGIAAGDQVIGFVGSFGPWHGAPYLAKAFGEIARERPNARLLLVGDGPEKGIVTRILAENGSADQSAPPALRTGSGGTA